METFYRIKDKYIFSFLVLFILFHCNAQKSDTINCNINFKEYQKVMINNIKDRIVYTYENREEIKKIFNKDTTKLLLKNEIDSLYKITSIPVFKFKKNIFNNYKINVLYKIDFSNNFDEQYSNIYYKDEIVYESNFIDQKANLNEFAIFENSLVLNSFKDPERFGSLKGYLMKLSLERKYFTFFIDECPTDHLFIVDNGIVYAIFNPTPEGNYEKIEINEYFHKYYNKEFVYHKKPKSCKRYKKKYYFKVVESKK